MTAPAHPRTAPAPRPPMRVGSQPPLWRPEHQAPPPGPRGPCSAALLELLTRPPGDPGAAPWSAQVAKVARAGDGCAEDLQLTLYLLYALHLHGLTGVDDAWEWDVHLLAGARAIEARFEGTLRRRTADLLHRIGVDEDTDLRSALIAITDADVGPSLSRYLQDRATPEQAREFLVAKSVYQLKEADPHTFALPRLRGRAKNAAVEIQADEYGNGSLPAMHSELFATSLRCAGLDARMGAYVDAVPVAVLAADNAAVLFGLHRRLRGAALGHLCALEMTSSAPMRRYARGLRRVGLPADAAEYFLEHVGVDAVHEQLALHEMTVPFVAEYPQLRGDVLLGAAAATLLDADVASHLLEAWAQGGSALRAAP